MQTGCAGRLGPLQVGDGHELAGFEVRNPERPRHVEVLHAVRVHDRRHQTGVRFEELMTERNNMVKKHPNTKFILTHIGAGEAPKMLTDAGILIADDHAANRMVLQRLLQKAGHRVTSVG